MNPKDTATLIYLAIILAGGALGDFTTMRFLPGLIVLFGLAGFCLLAVSPDDYNPPNP